MTDDKRGTILLMGSPQFIETLIDLIDSHYNIEGSTFLKLNDEGYYSRYLDLLADSIP